MPDDEDLEEFAGRVSFVHSRLGLVVESGKGVGFFPFGEFGHGVDVTCYDYEAGVDGEVLRRGFEFREHQHGEVEGADDVDGDDPFVVSGECPCVAGHSGVLEQDVQTG